MAVRVAALLSLAVAGCGETRPLAVDAGGDAVAVEAADETSPSIVYECPPDPPTPGDAGPCPSKVRIGDDAGPVGVFCDAIFASVAGTWEERRAALCAAGVASCVPTGSGDGLPRLRCRVWASHYLTSDDVARACAVASHPWVDGVGCVVWK